jgi:2-haloalkanoic acid dehalogenase type II
MQRVDPATIRAVTFDCYGTLIDWDAGARASLARIAGDRGRGDIDPVGLRGAWEEIQWGMIRGPYRRYRDILIASTVEALDAAGVDASEADGEKLVSDLPRWPAFADTRDALTRLRRRGLKVGILSNIDRDLIEATIDEAGLDVDLVVTAEEVRSYKPAEGHFRTGLARLGLEPAACVHASGAFRYDIDPAHRAGMKTAFVRRNGATLPSGAVTPDIICDDVAALATALGA